MDVTLRRCCSCGLQFPRRTINNSRNLCILVPTAAERQRPPLQRRVLLPGDYGLRKRLFDLIQRSFIFGRRMRNVRKQEQCRAHRPPRCWKHQNLAQADVGRPGRRCCRSGRPMRPVMAATSTLIGPPTAQLSFGMQTGWICGSR
jgi:hypothetical protein